MSRRKLNVRFHNPNSVKNTAEHIGKIFVQAGKAKLERTLKENSSPKEARYENTSPVAKNDGGAPRNALPETLTLS